MSEGNLVYLNRSFVPESEARISVFDRGFLYGDGVFETMRAYDGRIFRLDEHMQRLGRSADLIGLQLNPDREHLAEVCRQLLQRNDITDGILRMSVTRGRPAGGIGALHTDAPTIVAFVRPPMPMPADAYTRGMSAAVVTIMRTPSFSLDARVKSLNFLNYILARAEAEQAGAYEAILLNASGHIAEASTANIFFVRDGTLVTPSLDCGILPGITRAVVLELAGEMGIESDERMVDRSELVEFEECFLTSSGIELLPVTGIDGARVGTGAPGPVFGRLHRAYRNLARRG